MQFPTVPENFGMLSIGGEAELIFPSGNSEVFASVEYKNAKCSTENSGKLSEFNLNPLRQVYKLDTYFLDIIFGGRIYKNLKYSSSIFAGAGIGINLTSGVFPTYQSTYESPDLTLVREETLGASPFLTLQLGYKFNKNYGIDFNYDSAKQVLGNKSGKGIAKVSEFGVSLRYTF